MARKKILGQGNNQAGGVGIAPREGVVHQRVDGRRRYLVRGPSRPRVLDLVLAPAVVLVEEADLAGFQHAPVCAAVREEVAVQRPSLLEALSRAFVEGLDAVEHNAVGRCLVVAAPLCRRVLREIWHK